MFKIILINVEFGQVLNERGDLQMREEKEYNPCFNSLSSALIKKDNLLERYIYSGVIIKNTETGKVIGEFINEKLIFKFLEEKKQCYEWRVQPFYKRFFVKQPNLLYYDGKH